MMGPVIHAAVGDTIKVVFKNMLEDNSVSMHPHGVFYDKGSEGSPYYDGLPGKGRGLQGMVGVELLSGGKLHMWTT